MIELSSFCEGSSIVRCSRCGGLVAEGLITGENGAQMCRGWAGVGHYHEAKFSLG
jgi:formylmethanofuran dehydrogenase subunit E